MPYQIVDARRPAGRPARSLPQHYALGGCNPAELKTLVFVARDVPALGYRTYRLVPAAERPAFASSLQVGEHWLENRFYRVELDPHSGAVASIFDKELGREWVDRGARHGFNQVLVRMARDRRGTAGSPLALGVRRDWASVREPGREGRWGAGAARLPAARAGDRAVRGPQAHRPRHAVC